MCKNNAFLRLMLICICVTMVVGCLSLGALAASANPVLQVEDTDSSASVENGKIQVSLARDDVFTYNEILDLSAATKDVPLLDVEFNPTFVGTADATRVKVRFTDLYDESNYITISLNNHADASGAVYVTAGAASQPQVGVEHHPNGAIVHTDSEYGYGFAMKSSMVGDFERPEHSHLVLYYDQAEKAIYADRDVYTWEKRVVADLDSADHFGEELWEGFTTGHVKMTVFATNYQADTCNFTISTVAGNSSFQDNADQSAPVIWVNSGYEPDQLPTALVGKPYPVFDAIAIDGCEGEVGYTVAVRNQATSAAVSVVDGKFTPTAAGVYVITYTAKDSSGNTATESVSVTAKTGNGLQVTLEGTASATDTGVAVKLFSGVSSTNASGNVSYSVTAKHQSSGEVQEIDPETLTFIPMTTGAWEITVTVKDHVSTVVKTFTVTANATSQPQVYDEVAVPKYFIMDASYNLPVLYGYDFSSGTGVATAMDVYVSGTQIKEQYTPSSTGSVTVTYRLTVGDKTCEKSYSATVVDVEGGIFGTKLDMRKFFYANGAVTESADSSSISYTASTDTTLEFLNLVQVKDLSFSFQVGSTNTYKKVNIYLTDPADSNKQVKLSYIRMTDGKAAFCVNDGPKKDLSSNFDGSSFTLSFSADTKRVSPDTGVTLKVSKFLDGSAFTGFTGSVARFSVEMAEVSGTAKVVMTKLNEQGLYYDDGWFATSKDQVAPQLFYEVPGDKAPGDEVTLPGVLVHDVLNPEATATVTVKDPNGSVLLNAVDATKDWFFTASTCGGYTVTYTVKDGTGNNATHTYTISVSDGISPVITLPDDEVLVTLGDTVTVATPAVTGNLTANYYVFDPEGNSVSVTGGKFVAAKAGDYSVRYMAVDGDGNYGFASYVVTAEEDAVSTTSYISQSVSLGSEVALNLWGNVPEVYRNSLSGVLAYDNTKQNFSLSQMTPAVNGMYNIQAKLAMGQMTEKIDLTVKHPVFAESYYKSYSIRNYLTALLEGNFDQDTKDLCLELMNLGAWAQKYFNYRTYDLVNKGYEITPANAMAEEAPTVNVTGSVDGIKLYGTTVLYLSQATVRFYFSAPDGVDGYTFTVDGTEYTPEYKSGLYYIETPGINPQNMADVLTVAVTDGANTMSTQYAPIWYFIRSYHKATDETSKGLMAAAYSYYKEAEVYTADSSSGSVQTPEAPSAEGTYICLDVLITTSDNSTEDIDLAFCPGNFEGGIEDCDDFFSVTAGTTTTIRLPAENYMLDGNGIPNSLGVAVLGGPEDGSGSTHTLKISNIRVEGALNRTIGLNNVVVASGTNGTGFTDATDFGKASVVDGAIVIEGGVCNDGHKITLLGNTNTVISLDMLLTTTSEWTDPIEVRFYTYDFDGYVHTAYTDNIFVTAGAKTTVQLELDKYLVDGKLPGIGIAVFGGPTYDTADRHTLTVSNIHLEGNWEQEYETVIASVKTGFGGSNSGGIATVEDGILTVTGGYCYDGHMITFGEETEPETTEPETTEPETTEPETTEPEATDPSTYISLDLLFTTLGGSTDPVEIGFYPNDFEGDINNWTDKITVTAGTTATIKLDLDKYLVDGDLPGIGFAIFGGPAWDAKLPDGYTPDRHTVTISNVHLGGEQSKAFDLSKSVWTKAADAGYTNANNSGVAAIGESIVITNGYQYDGHKITLVEDTRTFLCMDLLFTTLGGSTDPVEIGFYPNNFEGDINNWTDKITITAGTISTIKLDLEKYLVDDELPGIGFAIFGGPAWDAKLPDGYTPDRHTITISNARLEGYQSKVYDLSKSTWANGNNGTGFTNANGSGQATIGSSIVITDGFQYDGHKITLVEDTQTDIVLDMLITTLGGSTDPIEVRFFPYNYTGSVGDAGTDQISITAGTATTVKLDLDDYLVDGELTGIGFAILGGPTWDAKLPDGYTPDRHTITISNARLEGYQSKAFDLSKSEWASGTNAGYSWANSSGVAAIGESIVITDGYCFDGHKITLVEDTRTFLCMDLLFTTLGGSTDPVEIGLFPYNFEGDINNCTDRITVTAGTAFAMKLNVEKYLVDGNLPGIGFAIFGGPAWDAKLPDGYTPDRHTITISNARLEGYQSKAFDLSKSTWANGNNGTGFTNANGSGQATIGSSIVITDGFQYDGHKITLEEDTSTYLCMDMLLTTLGNSTDPVNIRLFNYNYEGSVGDSYTDLVSVTAGTTTKIKVKVDNYLVDGELPGFGVCIFGGPEWNTTLPDGGADRHNVVISNVRLEGVGAQSIDLNNATVANGTNGTGFTWANSGGTASIADGQLVITNGFMYDAYEITF